MCKNIQTQEVEKGIGRFLKGNEPSAIEMPILFAPCACGQVVWARIPSGLIWVEATPTFVSNDEIEGFSNEVDRS